MSTYNLIKFDASSPRQLVSVVLDNKGYTLDLMWDTRKSKWFCSILDYTGKMLDGPNLLTVDIPIFYGNRSVQMPSGSIVPIRSSLLLPKNITLSNLGYKKEIRLYYVSP